MEGCGDALLATLGICILRDAVGWMGPVYRYGRKAVFSKHLIFPLGLL